MGDAKNVIGLTMAELLQEFKNHITMIVRKLDGSGSFQNHGGLPKNHQEFLETVLKGMIPDSEYPTALFQLTDMLHELYQTQVVVLIDEYDTPMSYAGQHGYFSEVCRSPGQAMYTSHSLCRQAIFSARSTHIC